VMTYQDEKSSKIDFHFKGQLEEEELECFYRHHWIILMAPLMLYGVFLVFFTLFLIFMEGNPIVDKNAAIFEILLIMGFLFSTYYVHRFFIHIYNYFLDVVIITNYRIVDLNKTIILRDTKEVIDLAKIQDVLKKQDGLIRNILSYGKLTITLSSSSVIKTLHFVPNPDFHFRVINRKKRDYIQHKQYQRRRNAGLEPMYDKAFSDQSVHVD
jgi:hypothetical protein